MYSSYVLEWRRVLLSFAPDIRETVRMLARTHSADLATYFYRAMMEDESASALLSHDKVQTRLMASMQRWITQTLGAQLEDDLQALVAQQVTIGEVHARLEVPVHLVLRGARHLKQGAHTLLQQSWPTQHAQASQLTSAVIDQSMEAMSQGYAVSKESNERTTEAYRLFSVTQNLSTVREQLRADLLDWQNQCLFMHAMGAEAQIMHTLAGSDFGLWFRHKGADMFRGAPETRSILDSISLIDSTLLPALMRAKGAAVSQPLMQLREQARHIGLSLEALFTRNSELDAGRDALTQLLNRKFLPVVMAKEVAYARKTGSAFSVLAIDIDHFKQINDQHGHEAGDTVLQQIAALMTANIRGGDYLFRLGGEEFLMVLVDTPEVGALQVAEKLRLQVQHEAFQLAGNLRQSVTISIGMVMFDGHPDYQRLLRMSDEALYKAKNSGRNCVVTATP